MPLLNYTTEVPASKTAGEIQEMLRKHGAVAVTIEYQEGKTTGLSFSIPLADNVLSFRLPVKSDPVRKILMAKYKQRTWDTALQRKREQAATEQADRTAWRIVKDWIEAQLALIDVDMVRIEEVFLPYLLNSNGRTMFEIVSGGNFLLPERGTP